MEKSEMSPILTLDELAKRWGKPPSYIKYLHQQGTGPRFFNVGPRTHRYRLVDVLAWEDEQLRTV